MPKVNRKTLIDLLEVYRTEMNRIQGEKAMLKEANHRLIAENDILEGILEHAQDDQRRSSKKMVQARKERDDARRAFNELDDRLTNLLGDLNNPQLSVSVKDRLALIKAWAGTERQKIYNAKK